MEQWMPVPGYEGHYEVSNRGKVRSVDRVVDHGGWFRRYTGRVLSPMMHTSGYRAVNLKMSGRQKIAMVHALVLLAFSGPAPAGMEARHLNGDRLDNRASNLAWGTRQENADDRRRHGTIASGERQGSSKLTEADVLRIRVLRADGMRMRDLADKFGVSRTCISHVMSRKTWRHVP